MPKTVALRDDSDTPKLRLLARRSRDVRQAGRLLALACVHDGMSRADAARAGGMDRQTLRDWAHRFNDEGPEGLLDRKPPRERRLSAAQLAEFAEIVETGPSLEENGIIRWRRIDLKRVIEDRFGVVTLAIGRSSRTCCKCRAITNSSSVEKAWTMTLLSGPERGQQARDRSGRHTKHPWLVSLTRPSRR